MQNFTMLSTWIKMCGQAVDFEAYHIFFYKVEEKK